MTVNTLITLEMSEVAVTRVCVCRMRCECVVCTDCATLVDDKSTILECGDLSEGLAGEVCGLFVFALEEVDHFHFEVRAVLDRAQ